MCITTGVCNIKEQNLKHTGRKRFILFSSVQLLSHVWLFATPWTSACQGSLYVTNSQSLLKLLFIELMMPSNHLTLCCPLLLLPSIFPSIRVFSDESALHIMRPKYWSFTFNISPKNTQDWFPLELTSLTSTQSKGLSRVLTTVQKHQFFGAQPSLCEVQLSHPYMTTGKTMALNMWTFADKVMSLLFHMLSRYVIAFLPRSKCLLISWLQSLQWFWSPRK